MATEELVKLEQHSNNSCSYWCRKYFWEGQSLNKHHVAAQTKLHDKSPWHHVARVKYRRYIGLALPALFFHFWWWGVFIKYDLWYLFKEKFFMTITMVFGSIIAGMTSEGGASVAYPVMTLAFSIHPNVARDFSFMIQSCGMTAAAFTILYMRVHIEYYSLVFCSLGGIIGIIFGLEVIDPLLTPPFKKMGFVCIWFTFAFALFLLNRYHDRKTYRRIPDFKYWKGLVLLLTGFTGGIFSAFSGSGLDICSFSVLTLLFRVTEKTATPTSVILMAGNTLAGFYWRQIMIGGVSRDAWEFTGVCIPVVVLGAPLGSVIGSHFHRLVLAGWIYLTDTVALISAFCLVPQTPVLIGVSVGIVVFGFSFFLTLTKVGESIMTDIEKRGAATEKDNVRDSSEDIATETLPRQGVPGTNEQLLLHCSDGIPISEENIPLQHIGSNDGVPTKSDDAHLGSSKSREIPTSDV